MTDFEWSQRVSQNLMDLARDWDQQKRESSAKKSMSPLVRRSRSPHLREFARQRETTPKDVSVFYHYSQYERKPLAVAQPRMVASSQGFYQKMHRVGTQKTEIGNKKAPQTAKLRRGDSNDSRSISRGASVGRGRDFSFKTLPQKQTAATTKPAVKERGKGKVLVEYTGTTKAWAGARTKESLATKESALTERVITPRQKSQSRGNLLSPQKVQRQRQSTNSRVSLSQSGSSWRPNAPSRGAEVQGRVMTMPQKNEKTVRKV
eukprot:TRINITY_DN4815_c0_g1_i4.p1 TRINITY_DN4815_c0_g1~~TRINITY_DN4815_c0_g1_i4.p1  ORF type:complete len:262 (-),score=51.05 TRINITY_DN4815_c0_g1_i4:152-937(-)